MSDHADPAEFRALYPANWCAISDEIRFERAPGRCQRCDRPYGGTLKELHDTGAGSTRHSGPGATKSRTTRWSDIEDAIRFQSTRVVLATTHLDHNPRNKRRRTCALCQRSHLIHDRPGHLRQRWIGPRSGPMCRKASAVVTCRRRYVIGDLFLGLYVELRQAW